MSASGTNPERRRRENVVGWGGGGYPPPGNFEEYQFGAFGAAWCH